MPAAVSNLEKNLGVRTGQWLARHPGWGLTLAGLILLVPFLAKPFNIDDPLFIWAGKQIQLHPGSPYDFNVNWGWREFPMWKVTENPPLACYYIALAAGLFGWSEMTLHLAFLLPAIAVILGIWRLARNFCQQPWLAALLALCTPVFLVSGTTVMCDVLMLSLWVWAVVFWVEGLAPGNWRKLAVAGLLVALAEMTKYYAASLVPLLLAHGLASRRPLKTWGQFLLLPLAVLWAYQYGTQAAYGDSLLYRAMDYTSISKKLFGFSLAEHGLMGLAFTGGCLATAVVFMPLLWRQRAAGWLAIGLIGVIAGVLLNAGLWTKFPTIQGPNVLSAKIQLAIWVSGGVSVLALAWVDLWSRRNALALLLALWVTGTFVFATFFNWTINARSVLPLVPAVAILMVRRLEQNQPVRPRLTWSLLAASALLAWLVAWSDYANARAVRHTAEQVRDKYAQTTRTIWFQGHWGFQFYMESFGAKPVDFKNPALQPGDLVCVPAMNTNTRQLDSRHATLLEVFTAAGPAWLTTWNPDLGAGFYASLRGPLPFVFGPVPPESVAVYILQPPS